MSKKQQKTKSEVQQVKKLAEVLVNLLYELEAKYALVEPMIFDKGLSASYNGQGYAAKGYELLRISLYLDCIKDSSRLYHDGYKTSPSVKNVLDLLSNRLVHQTIRSEFSNWKKELSKKSGVSFYNDDAEVIELEKKFDSIYKRVKTTFKNTEKSDLLAKVKRARNKVIAHAEVKKLKGEFHRATIEDVGIKWGDVDDFIKTNRYLIFDIALLVNNTSYADSQYRNIHQKSSKDFWLVTTNKLISPAAEVPAD